MQSWHRGGDWQHPPGLGSSGGALGPRRMARAPRHDARSRGVPRWVLEVMPWVKRRGRAGRCKLLGRSVDALCEGLQCQLGVVAAVLHDDELLGRPRVPPGLARPEHSCGASRRFGTSFRPRGLRPRCKRRALAWRPLASRTRRWRLSLLAGLRLDDAGKRRRLRLRTRRTPARVQGMLGLAFPRHHCHPGPRGDVGASAAKRWRRGCI
mmetsp:Transcript_35449/g.97891  ORF Transcript_35449/g.97891 Transcript_35449/m.97891 type:complete len:209 (+) Transcript_35449:446-1072(+)